MSKRTPKGPVSLFLLGLLSVFCVLIIASCLTSGACWAQNPSKVKIETTSPQKLSLTVGKSVIIGSTDPVKRISLAAPEVVDSRVLSPRQIYIIAKVPGVTNLTLWGADDHVFTIIDLEVIPDVSRLKEDLYRIFPDEKNVKVTGAHDNVTLSGTISSTSTLSQVLALAEPYFPGKVVNLLEVSGVHQVMIEVRVAEMSRSLLRRWEGQFNFLYVSRSGGNYGFSLLNNTLTSATKYGVAFDWLTRDASGSVLIDALKGEGLLKILAEPNLITLSGKTANFLAGGEFPIPVPQGSGTSTTITIEYKSYGVGLSFTPVVLNDKKINLTVAPEVSELDFSNAVTIGGFVIPAVTTRRVSTVIELADGQSFAIAGLLKDEVREIVSKLPLLGEIPILGALFRSSTFQKNETELIVIVTPRLVKPLDMQKQTLPTDKYVEPDDFEFYLLGRLEGREKKPETGLRLEGEFGHIVPK